MGDVFVQSVVARPVGVHLPVGLVEGHDEILVLVALGALVASQSW